MAQFKNKLDELLAEAVLSSGIDKNVKITEIRDYVNKTPIDQLKTEISVITSKPELVTFQAVGVPASLQEVFLYTYTRLTNG